MNILNRKFLFCLINNYLEKFQSLDKVSLILAKKSIFLFIKIFILFEANVRFEIWLY